MSYIVVSIVCQPPPVVTVVLKVRMHCEACAQVIEKGIRKIKGTWIHAFSSCFIISLYLL